MQIMSSISRILFILALAASTSQLSADTNALNVCVFSSSVQAAQSTLTQVVSITAVASVIKCLTRVLLGQPKIK
jgi:hypothetical protein